MRSHYNNSKMPQKIQHRHVTDQFAKIYFFEAKFAQTSQQQSVTVPLKPP